MSSEDSARMLARIEHDGEADQVAVEEPLEIRVVDEPVAVTMRTPGHDEELALGFLHGEGLIEEVAVHAPPLAPGPVVGRDLLADLPERLAQPAFERTGGLHATGLFDAGGELVCVREDVGRHKALDKVIGWALRAGRVPLAGTILCVSGRLAFELVQKAVVAGCPILVGVGAPTSLAIEVARDRGLTLCGFARAGAVNVFSGAERVG